MVLLSGSWHSGRIYAQLVYTQLNVCLFFLIYLFSGVTQKENLFLVSVCYY